MNYSSNNAERKCVYLFFPEIANRGNGEKEVKEVRELEDPGDGEEETEQQHNARLHTIFVRSSKEYIDEDMNAPVPTRHLLSLTLCYTPPHTPPYNYRGSQAGSNIPPPRPGAELRKLALRQERDFESLLIILLMQP